MKLKIVLEKMMSETRKFDKEILKELLYCNKGEEYDGFKYVAIIDRGKSRWESQHTFIFEYEGKLWGSDYSVGLTEQQDTCPWDYNEPVAYEVEPYEVKIIKYRKK